MSMFMTFGWVIQVVFRKRLN